MELAHAAKRDIALRLAARLRLEGTELSLAKREHEVDARKAATAATAATAPSSLDAITDTDETAGQMNAHGLCGEEAAHRWRPASAAVLFALLG